MDQSDSVLLANRTYGGSDSTRPDFNRQAYVKYNSVHDSRDLGPISNAKLDFRGVVGAKSGTQTLFFSFDIEAPSRIGLRRIRINKYTDQYVMVSLRNNAGPIALGDDGFAGSELYPVEVLKSPYSVDLGYVNAGYWQRGYATYDYALRDGGSAVVLASEAEADEPFTSSYGILLPPGKYWFLVSSSQWTELPYRVQLAVIPLSESEAVLEMESQILARAALSAGSVAIEMSTELTARAVQVLEPSILIEGETTITASPTILSPYG